MTHLAGSTLDFGDDFAPPNFFDDTGALFVAQNLGSLFLFDSIQNVSNFVSEGIYHDSELCRDHHVIPLV